MLNQVFKLTQKRITSSVLPLGKYSRVNFSTSTIKAELEAEIKANPVVIYSKSSCPYCSQTKQVFQKIGANP